MALDTETVTLLEALDEVPYVIETRRETEYGVEVSAVVEPEVGGTFQDQERVKDALRRACDGTNWDFVGLQHDGRTDEHIGVFER